MKNQRKEERQSFRKVFLMIPLLFLTIAGLSVATYAFWNSLQTNKNVVVPVGGTVSINVVDKDLALSNHRLVPVGENVLDKQVTSISKTYTVSTDHSDVDGNGKFNLVVTVTKIKLGGTLLEIIDYTDTGISKEDILSVIKTSLHTGSVTKTNKTNRSLTTVVTQDSVTDITITISLDFSSFDTDITKQQNIANEIKNKNISFTLEFTLEPVPTPQP